ncbi:MAG TPA: ABC transporter permease, partial [Cytophagales bacterium]|nr:ABC transporter permease [Cytophagales bacterium]
IFQDRWVWRMAWRDGRHNLSRLFLFMAALISGISAIVAISSLNYSFHDELDRNAKELLGADLVINSNKKFDSSWFQFLDSAKVETARNAEMASMVLFMNSGNSRLARVTALQGRYPFYGKMSTQPANAYDRVGTGEFVMIDESLANQFNVHLGDSLKIGNKKFLMAGVVTKMPGGNGFSSTIAPTVYISLPSLDSTGLVQYGSRVGYSLFIKLNAEKDAKSFIDRANTLAQKLGNSVETVERRKEGLGRGFRSVYQFFALLAFLALILGCIGVASSVHIYAREKRDEVAMLRCIGSSGWQAFHIYFIQVFILGLVGSLLGAILGAAIHQLLPIVFKQYLPGDIEFHFSLRAFVEGIITGAIVSVLFTVLPLVSVRFVPPLTVLRADFVSGRIYSKTKIVTIVLIIIFPILAAAYQIKNILSGTFFVLGIGAALVCLILVASGLLFFIRRYFPKRAPFIFRHALSNLFRANNQTRMLIVAIGLGAFIISVLNIIEHSLLNQVEFKGKANQSNTILFDIQSSQKEGVVDLIRQNHLPVNQLVPIVTCRLNKLKGKTVEEIRKDTVKIPHGMLTREYRVTYRDSLTNSEELLEGKLQHLESGKKDSVFVTISDEIKETLKLKVGNSLEFDMQGVPMKAIISGVRKVQWPKDPPNFIFVFPSHVLEAAPQIWVATTLIKDESSSAQFQKSLVTNFPNVSLIDLRLVLKTVNELFDKIRLVVRFLALFSIVTGLVVLTGAVINSKFIRIKENVLLRTIGASTKQIVSITLIEYAYLGLFSALTALILSLGGGWLLTKFFFEVKLAANYLELLIISIGVMLLTMLIGWYNSRDVISTSPLQALRREN